MCVRLPVDPVTFLDSYLDSVFILRMLVVWCFTVFTHKHHWVALLRVQKLSLMSWPDLIATSGAHSALIWQYAWEGGTVFRCCSSLAKVSEDSIMSSVYSSRSGDDCFFSAFVKKIWALIMNSILYVQFNQIFTTLHVGFSRSTLRRDSSISWRLYSQPAHVYTVLQIL